MYCSKCGKSIDASDKFCSVCGTPVSTTPQPTSTPHVQANQTAQRPVYQASVQSSVQQPVQQPMYQVHTQPAVQPNVQQGFVSQNGAAVAKKKKLQAWQIALIVLGALVCLFIFIGIISGGGSDADDNGGYTPDYSYNATPTSKAQKTKTVMIYMVGSDLESLNGAASLDIVEMMESGVDTSKHNVLIYTGGSKQWAIEDIPVDKNCIYQLNGTDDPILVKEYTSSNMGDSKTLKEFITYCTANYSSDEYGLILWNHGAGPLVGYGIDELHGDLLEMTELQSALSSAGFGSGKRLEFLGFDACLMGSIETACGVKEYTDYLIASQETEPGTGWDYSFLKYLDNYDSGKDIGTAIIDTYFSGYQKIVAQNPQLEADMTLSCLDLSKLDSVESSLNALFFKVDSNILTGYFPTVSQYRNNVKAFGKFSTAFQYDLIDVSHLVSMLSADYKNEADKVNDELKNLVCYSKSNVNNASGVSIYHPYDNAEYMTVWIAQFKNLGFANEYANYISNFGTMLSKPSSPSWNDFGVAKGSAVKKGSNNELSIKLTDEQAKNYASSSYYILQKLNDNEYKFIFAGFDTSLAKDGTLSASYNNKAVFAVNDKTQKASDSPITMYQVRDGSGELKYNASAMFWKFGDNIEDWKTDPVEWLIKIQNGQPKALGAYLIEGTNGEEIPQKQLLDYKTYDNIEFSFSTRTPKKDASGNLLPYFQWDSTGNFYGNEYSIEDGFHMECRDINNKEDYYVMFVVNDIQGNSYASEIFTLPN